MKKVLIACAGNGHDAVAELPYILKKAGLNVTLMCSRDSRRYVSSFHDRWIESPHHAHGIIWKIVDILKKNPASFDWIILGDDGLLRVLAELDIDPALKTRIGPVGDVKYLGILGSKAEAARFAAENGILTPSFRVCRGTDEAKAAASAIGFPVMIKIDFSGGGEGVFKCDSVAEIHNHHDRLRDQMLLVEKYIEGELISIEPLFLKSHLVNYGYARAEIVFGTTGVSVRRRITSCPEMRTTLETIGRTMNLTGFCNMGFIRETGSGRHYLIEMDLRPNAWISYARFAGICFSTALRHYQADPFFDAGAFHARTRERTLSIFYREICYFLGERNLRGIFYWLGNRNGCWLTIPFYDPRFLFFRSMTIAMLCGKLAVRGMYKLEKLSQRTISSLSDRKPGTADAVLLNNR